MFVKDRLDYRCNGYGYFLFSVVLALLGLGVLGTPAHAHKVTIFAWADGDTVHTQSKFSGGKRVKACQVVVYDPAGRQLLEGTTDDRGEFSFTRPQKTALRLVLKASMGHLAEWTLAADSAAGVEVSETPPRQTDALPTAPPGVGTAAMDSGNADPARTELTKHEIEALVDASLDRKLAPVMDMLVRFADKGPGPSEIIGGIGYIFGLVGVGLYFSCRRKGSDTAR